MAIWHLLAALPAGVLPVLLSFLWGGGGTTWKVSSSISTVGYELFNAGNFFLFLSWLLFDDGAGGNIPACTIHSGNVNIADVLCVKLFLLLWLSTSRVLRYVRIVLTFCLDKLPPINLTMKQRGGFWKNIKKRRMWKKREERRN